MSVPAPAPSVLGAIGDTPLIRLARASAATGCEILGKAEFTNPGGSVKDRAARAMVEAARASGELEAGGLIVEGTAGNTGIGLALVGAALGHRVLVVVPRNVSQEKKDALRLHGAELAEADPVPYADPGNYQHVAARLAAERGGVWINQFDNTANRDAHAATTGPELWAQTQGRLDAFVCAVGTGGTLAGVARALRPHGVRIGLADPDGSAFFSYYTIGELKAEGTSITEGIGQARITRNLEGLEVDFACHVPDGEAVQTVFDLAEHEGLLLGGSSGVNVAGAIRMARDLGPGHTVATVLCDGGQRYASKLFDPAFLRERGLPTPRWM